MALTPGHEPHDQPELVLDHEGGVVVDDVGMVAAAHQADLFLQEIGIRASKSHELIHPRIT